MKIAIASTRLDLQGMVEGRLGTAAYLLVVETKDMSFEAMEGAPQSSGPGAGVMAVSLVVNKGAQVILVGHIAPHIAGALSKQGIDVVTDISGPVHEALDEYIALRSVNSGSSVNGDSSEQQERSDPPAFTEKELWTEALKKGAHQFASLLPRLVGVILLLGLFRGFVSEQMLLSLFPGSSFFDAVWGAVLGSVLAGNPVNSYVIGKGLLNAGIGLAAVTALMLAWVNVGFIQLPAESAALGKRFALVRNLAGFVMAVIMSFLVVLWQGWGV